MHPSAVSEKGEERSGHVIVLRKGGSSLGRVGRVVCWFVAAWQEKKERG